MIYSADHEFGGVSTDLKLSKVKAYLEAFTKALRHKYPDLWYIDAFAGTGERTKKIAANSTLFEPETEDRIERYKGSARIALDIIPPFQRLFFIEQNPGYCAALKNLVEETNSTDRSEIINKDANEGIKEILQGQRWHKTRAVMFLDPYGMSVDWETLKFIQKTEAIDVWYLVSLEGIFRQAALNENGLDDGKKARLTRMLGTEEWLQAWYSPKAPHPNLFGEMDESLQRHANVDSMRNFVHERLKRLFPEVLPRLRLESDRGVAQFALFFAISNPSSHAVGLAKRIAGSILNPGKLSHVRPR